MRKLLVTFSISERFRLLFGRPRFGGAVTGTWSLLFLAVADPTTSDNVGTMASSSAGNCARQRPVVSSAGTRYVDEILILNSTASMCPHGM